MSTETYFGRTVPDRIKKQWYTIEAARWRITAQKCADEPVVYPPTQHTEVEPSFDLCGKHLRMWQEWREWKYDPISGREWPGVSGTPFNPNGGRRSDMVRLNEGRRVDWDRKTLDQLEAIESDCSSDVWCGDAPKLLVWRPGGAGIIADCALHETRYEVVKTGDYFTVYIEPVNCLNGTRLTTDTMNSAKAKANQHCKENDR